MDGSALRTLTLDALGPYADPRARTLLEGAEVVVDEAVRAWTSSVGAMRAHRVRLCVDARSLGAVRAAPAIEDALHRAFAQAFTAWPHDTLDALAIAWNGALAARVEGYRGSTPIDGRANLDMALAEYLDGAGEPAEGASGAVVRDARRALLEHHAAGRG